MANAKRDNNRVETITGLLNTDGATITNVTVNPTTHILDVLNGAGGSDLSGDAALRDSNYVPSMIAVSSSDGITPVPIYINSSGQLLIEI